MRIVVCVKQIIHIYARTGVDPERCYLAPEDRVFRVNPYDESAMEMASSLKSTFKEVEIIVVTLGPLLAEPAFKRCLALGADQVVRIDRSDVMDPWQKSALLARAVTDLKPDLVLCGKESLDTRNGQVGALLAHYLEMPFVSAITELAIDQGKATVQRSAGRRVREIVECPMPAVFTVHSGACEPTLPTYEDKKRAQSLPIRESIIEKEIPPPKVHSEGIFPPRPRPKQVSPVHSNLEAYDRIQQLLTGSRVEKKGEILMGSSESQVEGILSYLVEHGFLLEEGAKDGDG